MCVCLILMSLSYVSGSGICSRSESEQHDSHIHSSFDVCIVLFLCSIIFMCVGLTMIASSYILGSGIRGCSSSEQHDSCIEIHIFNLCDFISVYNYFDFDLLNDDCIVIHQWFGHLQLLCVF